MIVRVDIASDVQARDSQGRLWSFLDEARDRAVIRCGGPVVTGDEADPVVAQVQEIVPRPGWQTVVMEPIGTIGEIAEVLRRARYGALWSRSGPTRRSPPPDNFPRGGVSDLQHEEWEAFFNTAHARGSELDLDTELRRGRARFEHR
jgi:hypothetical protein